MHPKTIICLRYCNYRTIKPLFKTIFCPKTIHYKTIFLTSLKDVQDIVSLKKAFPKSLDTTGNICLDPSFPQVQHARRKVPIECREAIEKYLQDMLDQGIITPVTEPVEWVSSDIPCKPGGSLHICLDPRDLNKAIIWEHYKAPTLDEIKWSQGIFKIRCGGWHLEHPP